MRSVSTSNHPFGWCGVLLLALCGSSLEARAQRVDALAGGIQLRSAPALAPIQSVGARTAANPVTAAVASAIIPGSGQLMLRQRRAAAYLVIEATGLAFYISQTRDGRRQRDRYRRISRDVARAAFNPAGPRGDWDYYERMEKFIASGDFDKIPGGAIDPETDDATYNGSIWLLARRTYWRDPDDAPLPGSVEFESAMTFYENRAVPHDMRWSWLGASESYQQFRSAIAGSNSAFRSAGHTASLVLANHFLSAVDAYVSAQVRLRRNEDQSVSAVVSVPIRY